VEQKKGRSAIQEDSPILDVNTSVIVSAEDNGLIPWVKDGETDLLARPIQFLLM